MCTSSNYNVNGNVYFGRNFDFEISYNEQIIITPRNYNLEFRKINDIGYHFAFFGICAGVMEYPLYYDAMNEKGLCIAGLNFQGNAVYNEFNESMINITPFEFIPYILSQCETVSDVKKLLENVNLVNINYSKELPLSPLHWHISDNKGNNIVVEPLKDKLVIYDNPVGVLTNNPSFDKQLFYLNNYRNLSNHKVKQKFDSTGQLELMEYSRGMGAIGLPGDLSSSSRFVKVAFTKLNSYVNEGKNEEIIQFFHILNSVEQQKGCTLVEEPEKYEYTIYTDCYDSKELQLYYKVYDGWSIQEVDLKEFDLNSKELCYEKLVC